MTKARDIMNPKKTQDQKSWFSKTFNSIQQSSMNVLSSSLNYGRIGYFILRSVCWFVVTTGMITALPLIFELKREIALEEFESAKINAELAQGRTPIELANSGLVGAVEPKVLS